MRKITRDDWAKMTIEEKSSEIDQMIELASTLVLTPGLDETVRAGLERAAGRLAMRRETVRLARGLVAGDLDAPIH